MRSLHAAQRVAVALCLMGTFALGSSARSSPPYFEVQPNPPSTGSDVVVVYSGSDADSVVFKIGDGEEHIPKVAKDGTFTIPKALLKAGLKLQIRDDDVDRVPEGSVCFVIEPGS